MLGILNYLNEINLFQIPSEYNDFKKEICEIMNIEEKYYEDIQVIFKETNKTKKIMNNKEDFYRFKHLIEDNNDINLFIKIIEGSTLYALLSISKIKGKTIENNTLESDFHQQHSNHQFDTYAEKEIENKDEDDNSSNFSFEDLKLKDNTQNNNPIEMSQFVENDKDNNDNEIQEQKEEKCINNDTFCGICTINKLKEEFYYCKQCDINICNYCAIQFTKSHRHPLLTISTPNVIQNNDENVDDLTSGETNEGSSLYYYIPNAMKNLLKIKSNEPSYLLYQARKSYDLKNISDSDLLIALNKAQGDIDEAVIILSSLI